MKLTRASLERLEIRFNDRDTRPRNVYENWTSSTGKHSLQSRALSCRRAWMPKWTPYLICFMASINLITN